MSASDSDSPSADEDTLSEEEVHAHLDALITQSERLIRQNKEFLNTLDSQP